MSHAEYIAPGRCTCCGHRLATWTADAILDAIRVSAAEHGEAPGFNDWHEASPNHPAPATVTTVFGTWNNAIRAAGYTPRPRGAGHTFWTKERIIEAILDWLLRTGEWPSTTEWARATPQSPCSKTVYEVFNTWEAMLVAAGWSGSCVVCDVAMPSARVGMKFCSRRCKDKAFRRRRDGLPVADAPGVERKCVECGTDLENVVSGCRTCADRARRRSRREVSSACRLAAVEPLTPAPAAEVFAASTSDRVADAPAVEEEVAA